MKKIKSFYHYHLARPFYSLIRPLQPILNLKKRTFFDKFKVNTKDGMEFWLYNNAFYWETEMFWDGFENFNYEGRTRALWCELSKKSQVILDIGANSGWFSVMAKAYNPSAIVHAFEPQPNIFKVLKKNAEINSFDIYCHQLALSNLKGELPFYNTGDLTFDSFNTTHGSLNKDWRPEKQKSILVQVDKLDDVILSLGIPKVDLIKIDVETYEGEVLEGYQRFLKEHKPLIILEIQDIMIGEKVEFLIDGLDYDFYFIQESTGLIKVANLGENNDNQNRNYLLVPKSFEINKDHLA
ncbi:FkbM family methyltransferase [Algoriphagus halophytocola]|uniref:FkbM family methyltransferase n=1 Tax=Algoriphagus halophytocola TaxID=2991499 RepID=UPI0022DDE946|nr:FkbM family methyltransferase [Algoriphagus sp. TR-M9]WBL41308.1 FkbM family methyltransferase [Algoriphagus sp. TR-M9]